jgi:hypothetical protein
LNPFFDIFVILFRLVVLLLFDFDNLLLGGNFLPELYRVSVKLLLLLFFLLGPILSVSD